MKHHKYILITLMVISSLSMAGTITVNDIYVTPANAIGSGNGTLDWSLFTHSGGEIKNAGKGFDYDNANATLPQGGGSSDIYSFDESFLTSGADLKSYYELNFGITNAGLMEIVLFLDLNETGAASQATNYLSRLDVVLNPDSIQGNPQDAASHDIAGQSNKSAAGTQSYIDQVYTGGTLISSLAPTIVPYNLPLQEQGAGWADYIIFTGIDPFALNDSDQALFNISMSSLSGGAEEIFLSGSYSSTDISTATIPEPTSILLLGTAGGLFLLIRRIFF